MSSEGRRPTTYTMVDIAIIGVAAAIFGVLFQAWWSVYYAVKAIGGPIGARLVTYGLWFMPAPLVATLIRKPGSALLGELVPAILEALFPQAGGATVVIYGVAQGAFSELAYLATGYRRFGIVEAAIAGALPAIPATALDAALFGDIYPFDYMAFLVVAIMISGAIYGLLAYLIARSAKR